MHHTFTYQHSQLPPVRPEIKAEIVALDCQIADLILKSQGNYRELDELAEMLGNSFDSCQLNLQSIRIIADDAQPASNISMKDLPFEEKRLIYSCSRTNNILLQVLSGVTGRAPESLANEIAKRVQIYSQEPTQSEIEDFVDNLVPWAKEAAENSSSNYLYKEGKPQSPA